MHYLLIQTGRDVRDETSKINKTETFCCLMAPFCEISLLLLSRFVRQFPSMLMIKLFLGRWHSFANLWEHILELVHYSLNFNNSLRKIIHYLVQLEYHVTFSISRYIWRHVHISILGYKIGASWFPFLKDFAMYMMTLEKNFIAEI